MSRECSVAGYETQTGKLTPAMGPPGPVTAVQRATRVLALGSLRGQQTVKLSETIDQKIDVIGTIAALSIQYQAKGAETVVVATGAPAAPGHIVFTIPITSTGPIAQGKVKTIVDEVVKAAP